MYVSVYVASASQVLKAVCTAFGLAAASAAKPLRTSPAICRLPASEIHVSVTRFLHLTYQPYERLPTLHYAALKSNVFVWLPAIRPLKTALARV